MKVLFVSDFGLHHTRGGAQRSNEIIKNAGIDRGHDVVMMHYDTPLDTLSGSYDAVISSNLEYLSSVNPEFVSKIPYFRNHVRLEHDSNLYWPNDFRKHFWGSCKISFFLTHFHHNFFVDLYGDFFPNVRIIPDPISGDFYDMDLERDGSIGYVGFMHKLKGTDNFIKYAEKNQEQKFKVAGWGSLEYIERIKKLKNVEFLGELGHDSMSTFYNTVDGIFYDPVCNEPFCRSVGEALMCGAKIYGGSNKIGSLEMFNKVGKQAFRRMCEFAQDTFWEIIECQLQ